MHVFQGECNHRAMAFRCAIYNGASGSGFGKLLEPTSNTVQQSTLAAWPPHSGHSRREFPVMQKGQRPIPVRRRLRDLMVEFSESFDREANALCESTGSDQPDTLPTCSVERAWEKRSK